MSQETKNQAFHRLAQARKEALLDKIRLFGQLSGPSYDWNQDEVWAYFSEITQALEQALLRFQEQKRWTGAGIEAQAEASAGAEADDPESPAEPEEEEAPEISREQRRKRTIGQLIQDAKNDIELLPELIVLHKEVIDYQQAVIDELRGQLPKIVS